MSVITVFDNDQITIWYYPDQKIIHHEMHKYTHGQVFREAITAGTEVMEKNHIQKWLSDDRMNPVLNPDDQKWAMDVWQPRIIKAGWKFWAIVQPENLINKMRMGKMAEIFSNLGVKVELFTDPDEAMKWLKSQ